MRRLTCALAVALAALALARLSGATDGVLEIDAARAAAGGVTPGDAPGFPVEIFTRGNFRLTGDLVVPAGASAGIAVYAAGTEIDLNGFTISSTTTCSGTPLSCAPSGTGVGIDASGADSVVVRNGRITGFGVFGVSLFAGSSAEKLRVDGNALGGITTDAACEVTGNIVRRNGGPGITVGPDSRIAENVVSGNAGPGISAPVNALTDRNAVNHNGQPSSGAVRGRRFYLTSATLLGDQTLTACVPGFHFASLWEIFDPTQLTWDREHGTGIGLPRDVGLGPPSSTFGWVRTGLIGTSNPVDAGTATCNVWTSHDAGAKGSMVRLDVNWNPAGTAFPWSAGTAVCSFPLPAWCVED